MSTPACALRRAVTQPPFPANAAAPSGVHDSHALRISYAPEHGREDTDGLSCNMSTVAKADDVIKKSGCMPRAERAAESPASLPSRAASYTRR